MDSIPVNLSSPLLAKPPANSSILTSTSSIVVPHEILEIKEEKNNLVSLENESKIIG
jgi:hypothetical protein